MVTSFRMVLQNRRGRCHESFRAPGVIHASSVIHISASEVDIPLAGGNVHPPELPPSDDVLGRMRSRFVGSANITVMNVSPTEGRVDFVVFVDRDVLNGQ